MASSSDVQVTFDAALDGGGWPGPLAQAGGVVYGSTWVGPLGLVDLLEKRLGLGGRFDSPLERACRLVPKLSRLEGHWSKSFAVDPLATSRGLLRQRDELRCFGWTGQTFSARLGELNVATTDASVGIPDRLEAVARALPAHSAGIEHLVSFTPIAQLAPVWRAVFVALSRAGVTVEERTIAAVTSAGDLAGARQRAFLPRGDGRICLLRRHGPLDVADEIAAYLAAWDNLDGVVVVAPDSVLDAALARHGVPRLGANAGTPASTRLLCLVVEAAFRPMEMCDLHALLAAEPGPIPKAIAVTLMAVLGRWPGRGSQEWKEALAPAPPTDTDADSDKEAQRREDVRQRAELLVSPVCARSGRLAISDLRARLQALDAWARSRAPFVSSMAELSRQIGALLDTVELMGADSFSWHDLRRLCQEIGESAWSWAPADAGLACVSNPGAILAPARAVIWWDFSRDRAPSRLTMRLTPAELVGFRSAGLVPPDPTLATQVLAAGWRRPLTQATEALVLACPATSSGGEANYPHPLWDEITASLENHRDARKLERRQVGFPVCARTVPIAQRSLVVASETIEAKLPLLLRESESPSSLEKLMGCSLSWALHYRARLRSGFSAGPAAPGPLLFGLLAHRLLAQVWSLGDGSPAAAAAAAGSLFDQQCDDLCEELGLPQHQSARATVRRAVVESARELVRLATKYGAVRTKTEVAVGAVVLGHRFDGHMDLVWENLGVIVDLKWGKSTPQRLLETGAAVQLAAYGAMWQQGGEGNGQDTGRTEVHRQGQTRFPETAYFCLQTQEHRAREPIRDRRESLWKSHGLPDVGRRSHGVHAQPRRPGRGPAPGHRRCRRPAESRFVADGPCRVAALHLLRVFRLVWSARRTMNIRIVTASAGTGKTTHLAHLLEETLGKGDARPEAILATTFTRQAAEELLNRARTRLLRGGLGGAAQAILAARIGTVNAVCGALVTEFAFELGLSPELRVLDEDGAELTLKRALALVVTERDSNRLQDFQGKFDAKFDWQYELQRLIEAARANGLDAAGVAASAQRSIASLDECLGPAAGSAEDLDAELHSAISTALTAIRGGPDTTSGTREYCEILSECLRDLDRSQLRWGDWAKLSTKDPTKKSLAHAIPVKAAAARHLAHPRLRMDLHELIALMFDLATRGLEGYQALKRAQGLLDFVDQEVVALELLSRPAIQAALADELDLVLVDEFQDTSPLQLAIFLKLAECARSSVWVGDPKQAIFGFRGTDPALMDAAIESLSTPTRDGDLIAAAVDAVSRRAPVETLSHSYRSRPALVAVTNAVFCRAFARQQGMPDERVRVEPERKELPGSELGPALGYWPLSPTPNNAGTLAASLATGVRDLLGTHPTVWDREGDTARGATAKDLAILCRTNKQCREVSEALGQLGIASMVARVGLLDTAEGQVLTAGLRLWVDPRDRLAAATLVRILEDPEDASDFVEMVLAEDAAERLARNPAVSAVSSARENMPDLDIVAVVDAVIDATDLRRLCAAWGDHAQRIANLDALLSHAVRYSDQRRASGDAPSLVGFLAHLGELLAPPTLGGWGGTRVDTMARMEATDAVTVSTWHGAKGLEWPIVVLFGLESVREPVAYGVHVLSDRRTFDVRDPLGGRHIHFWPNPYTTSNQKGPVRDAYAASDAHAYVSRHAEREALRVLYVGWTRARDRLILAARRGKLLEGLLATLTRIEPGLVGEPDGTRAASADANWAGHAFQIQVTPHAPASANPAPRVAVPGDLRTGRPPVTLPRASWPPSSAPARPGRLGEPIRLGAPFRMKRTVEVSALGDTVHAFFGSDWPTRAQLERLATATGLLDRYRVSGAIEPADLLEFADRLWRWVHDQFGNASVIRTEWPLGLVMDGGTRVLGTSDLVIEVGDHTAVVDHKSLGLTAAASKVDILKGQLGCYAAAVARAMPSKTISTWLHLPFEGVVVEVT